MVSNKFKRSQERKERREAEKLKENKKDVSDKPKKPKPKWRRLNDGGIAFGDKFKIGRGGQIGFSVVGAMILFFVVGLTLYPIESQEGGECANPFCEWIDILTGADEYGAKQTPKEQVPESDRDFLPPVKDLDMGFEDFDEYYKDMRDNEPAGFLFPLILPEAEARGDDEPTCYSIGCQRALDEGRLGVNSKEHFDSEDAKAKSINEQIVDMKVKIEKTKEVIKVIEKKIRDFKLEIPQDELDLMLDEKLIEDQEKIVKEMKYEYDRLRYGYDSDALFEFEKEYDKEKEKLEDMVFDYEKKSNYIQRDNDLLDKEEEYLDLAEVDLLMFIDELNALKIQLHQIHRAGNLFAIRLSETCNTLIEQGMNEREVAVDVRDNWVYETKTEQICPTYRDLVASFDNTLQPISGEFEDLGYDIRRGESGYKDYWRYYYNLPGWKVITVDPDVDMLQRAMVIEIQASDFRYASEANKHNLNIQQYSNGTMSERGYVYFENVSIDKECRHANVAPDIELVGKVLEHFMNECKGDLDYVMEHMVRMPYISFDVADSKWYKYITWLNKAIASSNELQIGR